jgi:hypothetical protein
MAESDAREHPPLLLVIHRPPRYLYSALGFDRMLDGVLVGCIRSRETVSIPVDAGPHVLL